MGGRQAAPAATRYVRRPRSWETEIETAEDPKYDYSTITVYDDEPRFTDTGLVFPDGEPVYRESGAPLGFPITSDRKEEHD